MTSRRPFLAGLAEDVGAEVVAGHLTGRGLLDQKAMPGRYRATSGAPLPYQRLRLTNGPSQGSLAAKNFDCALDLFDLVALFCVHGKRLAALALAVNSHACQGYC